MTSVVAARDVFDEIEALFAARGHETYGENVTIAEHCLQAAALARAAGADDALVVAALLHDIGYFLEPRGDASGSRSHDRTGGAWLAARFPAAVSEPVRLHVAAKRYLCAVERNYLDLLSPASKLTLARQGGPMSAAEAAELARHPFLDVAVQLRRLDDRGKVAGEAAAPLRCYREAMLRLADAPGAAPPPG